jgi:hypothetical protein
MVTKTRLVDFERSEPRAINRQIFVKTWQRGTSHYKPQNGPYAIIGKSCGVAIIAQTGNAVDLCTEEQLY